jgi:dihydroxyacetone kinase-like protein
VSPFSGGDLRRTLAGMIARTRECEEELNILDAELGDGDLGSTLVSVAAAVERGLAGLPDDISVALTELAKLIGGISGSSFSSLLMIGLSKAGMALPAKQTVDAEDRKEAWRAALVAMLAASGAQLGDKTMLDVMAAMAQAPPGASLLDEIDRTLERYRPKACRAGRARVAGDRSVGRDDPGMVAMLRLVEGATGRRAAG